MCIVYNIGKSEYQNWIVGATDFRPEFSGKFETIFNLGNGYMAVRAATEEIYSEEKRGCYVAGVFDGFSGEGYKGHVFWDTDIFLLPFFIYTFPDIAQKLLLYRYHFLDGARRKAKENGFKGAMYPWECSNKGNEVTPRWGAVDLKTGKPVRIRFYVPV